MNWLEHSLPDPEDRLTGLVPIPSTPLPVSRELKEPQATMSLIEACHQGFSCCYRCKHCTPAGQTQCERCGGQMEQKPPIFSNDP